MILVYSGIPADIVLLSGLTILIISNVLTPQEVLAGFSNQGLLAVGALFIVTAGLKESGAFHMLILKYLGYLERSQYTVCRVMTPILAVSAFISNTQILNLIPTLERWSRRNKIPLCKILLPAIYAVVFGGACTLIGTSVNLIINQWGTSGPGRDERDLFFLN